MRVDLLIHPMVFVVCTSVRARIVRTWFLQDPIAVRYAVSDRVTNHTSVLALGEAIQHVVYEIY